MADMRLACTGVRAGGWFIPRFQLRSGDVICLHVPEGIPSEEQDHLTRLLTGRIAAEGLRIFGRIVCASPAADDRNAWLRLVQPLNAEAWLRRIGSLSSEQAVAALKRLGVEPDEPLTRLAGTPKTLLGLEAARGTGADAIVYQTGGLDPAGVRTVHAAVASGLAACPAIHLSRPVYQNDRPIHDCFPDGKCVELTHTSGRPVPAESA